MEVLLVVTHPRSDMIVDGVTAGRGIARSCVYRGCSRSGGIVDVEDVPIVGLGRGDCYMPAYHGQWLAKWHHTLSSVV